MQLKLRVEPSSGGPVRTQVEKIMLMLYAENTLHGKGFFSLSLSLSLSSLPDNKVELKVPLPHLPKLLFENGRLKACVCFCLQVQR